MRLWTRQSPNFSLLEGRVDYTKSQYLETIPTILEAYRELWRRIETDQIIWCCTAKPEGNIAPYNTEIEWTLDVLDSEILRFVDEIVWCRIRGGRCGVSPSQRHEWWQQAVDKFPDDSEARDQYKQQQFEAYWAKEPPPGGWWIKLFVNDANGEFISALIGHPIQPEWVIGRQEVKGISGH